MSDRISFVVSRGVIAACALASQTAHAGFIGFFTEVTFVGGDVFVFRAFAQFSDGNYNALSVTGAQGLGSYDWIDSDFAAGTWAPQLTIDPAIDSYVTIGGSAGFTNTTGADPFWGASGFLQPAIPDGAGWFNDSPPNGQGSVDTDNRTLIGQFVTTLSPGIPSSSPLTIAFNQGLGTPTQFAEGLLCFFVPSAGTGSVIAMVLYGALVPRRRRA